MARKGQIAKRTGKHGAGNKRAPAEVVRDRAKIARLRCRGATLAEIAEKMQLSKETVYRDVTQILSDWKARAEVAIDKAQAAQLAKLDEIERAYWRGWERSVESGDDGGPTPGDPRMLAGVLSCIDRRCKLMGLDAPDKLAVAVRAKIDVEGDPVDELDDGKRAKIISSILERAKRRMLRDMKPPKPETVIDAEYRVCDDAADAD